jgi:2-oxoacid:acceptor oxidoreductase delta subunit (pyruvate/2-ketoisovalerate family)
MSHPFATTLEVGSSLVNRTGSWRTERPVYVSRTPPCNHACPAGEEVQRWLYHAESGDYKAAWKTLVERNPFPATMGRICYHPCESQCNRGQLDQSVNIHAVERFLGDEAIRRNWQFESTASPTGKNILIVGAGPCGLSAAYQLSRLGHDVTIHEAGPLAGGMMQFGIPKYRLPREILNAEIARIEAGGVTILLNHNVGDLADVIASRRFEAVFLATGAQIAKRAWIPAGDSSRIMDALKLLRDSGTGQTAELGRRVVIYGGGNTAMDAARTAKRLGATDALIVYRRTREKMPAHEEELQEALEEGIKVKWLFTIKAAEGQSITVEKMRLNSAGFPEPTGEFETIEADSVVLALGQDTDLDFLRNVKGLEFQDGLVKVDGNMMTGYPGIFAGGDVVPSERTATIAIGHGRKAALDIDAYLRNVAREPESTLELASFDRLNTWYYTDAPKTVQSVLDSVRRQTTFEEVIAGLDETNALFEARRCLSCGNCFACDNCYGVCPDNAVIKSKNGQGYQFNYDFCKGCGLCAAECPCGAIRMEPEEI